MAVMSDGDIVVGSKPPVRKPKAVISEKKQTERVGVPAPFPGHDKRRCGAMSQQPSAHGAASTPQKFVHLVGCHDPKAAPPKGR
jgi:hypothetical protein